MTKKTQNTGLVETCPSFRSGHLPNTEDVQQLRDLTAPHVDSFNYFLDVGLSQGIQDIEPAELALVDPRKSTTTTTTTDWSETTSFQFWVEDVRVSPPIRSSDGKQLLPRECRERNLMYAGPMTATFCYTLMERRNGQEFPGKTVRLPKRSFGNIPICVLSKACHLHNMEPRELVKLKEEVCMYVIWVRCLETNALFTHLSPCVCLAKRSGWVLCSQRYRTMCPIVANSSQKSSNGDSAIEL